MGYPSHLSPLPRGHSLWTAPCNLSCLSWRQDDQSLYNCEKFFRSFCFCHIFFSMTCKMVFMSTLFSVKTGLEKLWYFNHLLGHFLIVRLVFCFENCLKLLWEKIFWWLRKMFSNLNLANFLRSLYNLFKKWEENFWKQKFFLTCYWRFSQIQYIGKTIMTNKICNWIYLETYSNKLEKLDT